MSTDGSVNQGGQNSTGAVDGAGLQPAGGGAGTGGVPPATGGRVSATGGTGAGGTGGPTGGSSNGGASNGGASGAPATGGAGGSPAVPKTAFVYVGSGDFVGTNGSITLYRFDYRSVTLTQVGRLPIGGLASFLAFDTAAAALFAADEADGNLRLLGLDAITHVPIAGSPSAVKTAGHPVHVTATRDGRHALVAHYSEGKAESFGVSGAAITGSLDVESPGAQAHEVVLAPDERFALVPCKGSDRIARFTFDSTNGALVALAPVPTQTGDGPRHLAFHPNGSFAYVITELSSTVIAYAYSANDGSLTELARTSALPQGFSGTSTGAEIAVVPSGRFVYASNRISGQNGDIAAFRVAADGRLTSVGHQSTGGNTPRSFSLDPTGQFLFVGNQDSNSVAVLSIDTITGALGPPKSTDVGVSAYFVGVAPFTE